MQLEGILDAKAEKNISPTTTISLPLSIIGFGDRTHTLRQKIFLVDKFNFFSSNELMNFAKKERTQELSASEISSLEELWNKTSLDDLDYAELFVAYLPTLGKGNPKFLSRFDPQPVFHRTVFKDKKEYERFVIDAVDKSARNVRRFVLPRVRAKLAAREIVFRLTTDLSKLAQLIELTPRYLACPAVVDLIAQCRRNQLRTTARNIKETNAFLRRVSKAILSPVKKQPRNYGYWQIDYYFNEVRACIRNANELGPDQRRDYLSSCHKIWDFPSSYLDLLSGGPVKNPAETTLELMVAKGMIDDPSTYRNVIRPHVKKITERYPSIRACDFVVENVLDFPTRYPGNFSHLDLWEQLESFDFDLSEKELDVGHHISYPGVAFRV